MIVFVCLFVCVEVLRPVNQLESCRAWSVYHFYWFRVVLANFVGWVDSASVDV